MTAFRGRLHTLARCDVLTSAMAAARCRQSTARAADWTKMLNPAAQCRWTCRRLRPEAPAGAPPPQQQRGGPPRQLLGAHASPAPPPPFCSSSSSLSPGHDNACPAAFARLDVSRSSMRRPSDRFAQRQRALRGRGCGVVPPWGPRMLQLAEPKDASAGRAHSPRLARPELPTPPSPAPPPTHTQHHHHTTPVPRLAAGLARPIWTAFWRHIRRHGRRSPAAGKHSRILLLPYCCMRHRATLLSPSCL